LAEKLAQGVLNGLAMGWIYILIALGLTLIFGIMRTIQFAHGEIYMLGAYLSYYLVLSRIPLIAAVFISMTVLALLGYALERLFFARVRHRTDLSIVLSLGLLLILQTSAVMAFGLAERSMPRLSNSALAVGGVRVATERIIAMALSVSAVLSVFLFLKKTKCGLALVACAQTRDGAALQGIDPDKMARLVMIIGCALGALGGTVAASILKLSPFMGGEVLSKGLVIVVFGGMGSLTGTIVSGLLFALTDSVVQIYLGSAMSSVLPLVMVIGVLLVRPQGLFGHA